MSRVSLRDIWVTRLPNSSESVRLQFFRFLILIATSITTASAVIGGILFFPHYGCRILIKTKSSACICGAFFSALILALQSGGVKRLNNKGGNGIGGQKNNQPNNRVNHHGFGFANIITVPTGGHPQKSGVNYDKQ